MLRLALGYRKSYCRHLSSDIEYALLLGKYILSRSPGSALANHVVPGLERMLAHMRSIEFSWRNPSRIQSFRTLAGAWRSAVRAQRDHEIALARLGQGGEPVYKLLNDNRYEQHSWLWKSI